MPEEFSRPRGVSGIDFDGTQRLSWATPYLEYTSRALLCVHEKHKPKGLLLRRIKRAFEVPEFYRSFKRLRAGRTISAIIMPPLNPRTLRLKDIKAKAEEVKDKTGRESASGSAASDIPPKKKVKTSTPTHLTLTDGDEPEYHVIDESGNKKVPQNSTSIDHNSIAWSKIQSEMLAVNIGNLEASGLDSQIARALNHSVQATMAISCALANLEISTSSTSKLDAELATLRIGMEKVSKEKVEAEVMAAKALEESKSYKDRLVKVKDNFARLHEEFEVAKKVYDSELGTRDNTIAVLQGELDAARKGEGLDFDKLIVSEVFQPTRATMEQEIAQGLVGMIKEKNPGIDLTYLYGEEAETGPE